MARLAIAPLLFFLIAAPAAGQDCLVIAPRAFHPALKEWRALRESQGHTVAVRVPEKDLRAQVRATYRSSGKKLRYLLLLGDAAKVACGYSPGVVIRIWERDPRIANDNWLADLDGDKLPDLAVGRLPADNPAEAALLLSKTIVYEQGRDFGTWRRRVNVIAGMGGFGKLQDWALEQVATKFLRENVPPAYDLDVTYANPSSAFCPPPARIGETVLERFNEGALIVAYLGHGSRQSVDNLPFKNRIYPIFDEDAAWELKSRRGAPIAFFCACSTGHFDGAPDCLAEVALKRKKGPVAVIASSRVSMPYANAVLAKELLDALFDPKTATVGDALMRAKRRMMNPAKNDAGRQFIETLAIPYKWKASDRAVECAEHLYLYNLLGDPTLRLHHPPRVALTCAEQARPGTKLAITGRTPLHGRALLELVADRSPKPAERKEDTDAAFAKAYAQANARVRARLELPVAADAFGAALELPENLTPGTYYVRIWITGSDGAAMGARKLTIR